jgi:predicted acyltransferase
MNKQRLASIDVFRAITMYLMVFVNSLWTVNGVPQWLEHAPAEADDMGFSDVIFPAFLFIVGLSIPFAIENRLSKGESKGLIFRHILLRSLALIVMGFFHVNMENYSNESLLPKSIWILIITIAFFFIWLDYKTERQKKWQPFLQITGVLLLILMAVLYKGVSHDGNIVWMRSQWWGILGLIGWAYLLCASIVLAGKAKLNVVIITLLFFLAFNIAFHSGWLSSVSPVISIGILDLGNASNSFLVMCGVLIALLYKRMNGKWNILMTYFILLAAALFIFGFVTRPLWGISKIRATPSWIAICAGISVVFFLLLAFITDKKEKRHWFAIIKPAGTSTLTCYLLPYLYMVIFMMLIDIRLPLFLRTGMVGIIKCLLFALLIVLLTGVLEKKKIRLKI